MRPPAIRVQAIRRTTRQPRERFLGFSGRARRGRPRCGKRSRVSTCRSCVARPLGKLRRRASGVCGTTGTTGRGAGQNHRRSPLRAERTHAIVHTCMTHELTRIHGGRPARADRRSAQTAGWRAGPHVGSRLPGYQMTTRIHDRARHCPSRITVRVPWDASGRSKPLRSRSHAASRDELPSRSSHPPRAARSLGSPLTGGTVQPPVFRTAWASGALRGRRDTRRANERML